MSKIAGEINAEMMHPKVIHEQRKALFAEMVRKTGSQQSVLDRLLQEIQFLRDHEGCPMDEEVIDILRGNVASLERQRDELLAQLKGARTVLDRLRTSRETSFPSALVRDGAMVRIQEVIESIDAAIVKAAAAAAEIGKGRK